MFIINNATRTENPCVLGSIPRLATTFRGGSGCAARPLSGRFRNPDASACQPRVLASLGTETRYPFTSVQACLFRFSEHKVWE